MTVEVNTSDVRLRKARDSVDIWKDEGPKFGSYNSLVILDRVFHNPAVLKLYCPCRTNHNQSAESKMISK
jgi:hypothetical protein